MAPLVLVSRAGPIATVTLNRPGALNALSVALMTDLVAVLDGLEVEPDVGGVILTGAGRAFCAGMDFKELQDPQGLLARSGGLWAAEVPNAVRRVAAFGKPIVAAVNGAAVTGGFELALACDIILASSDARFADTHARLGIVPGGGISQRLPRVIGPHRAKELSLTGRFLSAEEADRWGLVNRVVAPDDLLASAGVLLTTLLEVEASTLAAFKTLIDTGYGLTLAEGLALEERTARAFGPRTPADIARDAGRLLDRDRAPDGRA